MRLKEKLMKPGLSLSRLAAVVIIILIILNGCLLKQNFSYQSMNRELILQNDSLIAVAITLNKEIDKRKSDTLTKHSTRSTKR